MTKFKKIILLLPVIFLGLHSCSKSDSTPETATVSIEGKWQYTKVGTITNN